MSNHEVSARITARNETATGIGEAKANVESLGAVTQGTAAKMKEAFAGVSANVRVMGMNIRESIALVGEMREMMMHFGEAMLAAFAVEKIADWAKEMGEAAEKTTHLAQTFGMSVGQIQQLGGIAKATGISLDTITRGMGIFDKNLITAAGSAGTAGRALAAIGINSASGAKQMELLERVADKFKGMDDGPKKVALAMSLFGKSGKELIPILNLGAEGLAEINRKSAEYGLVNEAAVEKGMALAESVNESRMAMAGLGNVMTDVFAPVFKSATDSMNELIAAFIRSYNEGGTVAEVFAVISGTFEVTGQVFSALGDLISEVWSTIGEIFTEIATAAGITFEKDTPSALDYTKIAFHQLADMVVIVKDIILGAFDALVGAIEVVVHVIIGAFEVAYEAIVNHDWNAAVEAWHKTGAAIAADAQVQAGKITAAWNEAAGAMHALSIGQGPPDGSMHTNPKPKETGDGGEVNFGGGGGHHKKSKGPKKDKESQVAQEWRAELATMLADEKNWGADEAQLSADFWAKKLETAKKGSKEEIEATRELARAKIALFKEGQAENIAGIKQMEAIRIDEVKSDIALSRLALTQKLADIDEEVAAGRMSASKAVRAKADVSRQLYQLELDEENREYKIHHDAFEQWLELEHLKPKERADIHRQMELLEKQHANKKAVISGQVAQKEMADERAVQAARRANMQQLSGSWASTLAKMATLQQGFMGTIKGLWQGLVGVVEGVLQQIISKFIMAQLVKLGLVKAESAATIGSNAAMAGAGGVASMAAAPWPLDMTAPAFGASMAAAAMAFAPLAAAEHGWDVPASAGMGIDGRGGMSAIIHPREMVLPADLADIVRGGGSGGPQIHIHAVDAHSVRRLFMNHKSELAGALKSHQRNGGRG